MKILSKRRWLIAIGLISFFGINGAAWAQTVQPTELTETYGAWVYRCLLGDGTGEKSCEVLQSVRDTSGATVSQMAFGVSDVEGELKSVVQVPQGTLLTEPISVGSDDGATKIDIPYLTCLQSVCLGSAAVSQDVIDAFDKREAILVDIKDRTGKPIRVVYPAKGLGSAIARLRSD